ncbi:MAG: hypothetical protein QGH39_09870, partial [Candidatus Thermoplasmatota archaeon]|nr:hypothetical protein [Candidatus Thermoplasmatota archaeon]
VKIWIHKTDTFEAAERFDRNYYLSMSRTMRLETVQFLREAYAKMKNGGENESRKGLRRIITIIQ